MNGPRSSVKPESFDRRGIILSSLSLEENQRHDQ